mmetsp:Transcript_7189/g.44591  ORF Transcript_7189/g.44591 Transcript_7189/m.44591 type:complete len:127 (-) Transcript_7189:1727-2107(-)
MRANHQHWNCERELPGSEFSGKTKNMYQHASLPSSAALWRVPVAGTYIGSNCTSSNYLHSSMATLAPENIHVSNKPSQHATTPYQMSIYCLLVQASFSCMRVQHFLSPRSPQPTLPSAVSSHVPVS